MTSLPDTGRTIGAAKDTAAPTALGLIRRAMLLRALTEAADAGKPMPSTKTLCDLICPNRANPVPNLSAHLAALQKNGAIEIIYGATQYDRYVKIVATGKVTDWQIRKDGRASRASSNEQRATARPPGKYSRNRALAGGYSDLAIYGHLAAAVRFCRQHGDAVYRDPRNPLSILINGVPRDPKERQAWHERMRP